MVIPPQVLQDMGLPTGAEQKVIEPLRIEETPISVEETEPAVTPTEVDIDTATPTAKPEATDSAEVRPISDLSLSVPSLPGLLKFHVYFSKDMHSEVWDPSARLPFCLLYVFGLLLMDDL